MVRAYRTRRGWYVVGDLPPAGRADAPTPDVRLLLALYANPARGRAWSVSLPPQHRRDGIADCLSRYLVRFAPEGK